MMQWRDDLPDDWDDVEREVPRIVEEPATTTATTGTLMREQGNIKRWAFTETPVPVQC